MKEGLKISPVSFGQGRFWPVLLAVNFALSGWSDTFVVTNTANSGPGSLQQAILTANGTAGLNSIVFQISGAPPFTITPVTALPQINVPVVIDATTQPGFAGKPVIELNGASTSSGTVGLRFAGGGSTLRGMAINRFPAQAVDLSSDGNIVQGNFIGTDVTGALARGNGSGNSGPGIFVRSSNNLIGGTNSGDGNVISGGNYVGIYLQNASSNLVQGNLIGLNAAGTSALNNLNNGILINPGSGNLIGGPFAAARNVIAGNGTSGIYLSSASSTGNVVQGNFIGTDRSGGNAIGNATGDGVTINGAIGNVICSNVISANGQAGVSITGTSATGNQLLGNFIGTSVNGKTSLGNHYAGVQVFGGGGNQIGGTNPGDGNVISGNVLDGIALSGGSMTNVILGNLIGLSAAGTNALHNGQNGIGINGGSSNIVGGVVAGARNVISGNSVYGLGILKLADNGNTALGNYIGTDVTGTKAIANTQAGVQIQGSANLVGGTAAGAGNVISGNGEEGIYLAGTNGNVTGNVIQGNYIGVDATGANALGNYVTGVGLAGAANNLIGGTNAGARNVISANGGSASGLGGVFFAYAGTTGNQLEGNYIGTDASGTVALGNVNDGVYLGQLTATNFIGGCAAGAGNLISANGVDGIYLISSSQNCIQGNFIGTKADGTSALGNTFQNVELDVNAMNNIIGGVAPGAGNRIAFSRTALRSGVRVRDGSRNNLISGNSIFSNAELGIDLGTYGVTAIAACESGMTSANANFGQNFPTLTKVYSGATTRISGTMGAKSGKTYALQFFASPSGNVLGYGEGQLYLGQTNVTLGAACSSNFTVNLPASVPPGWVVTATATDTNNNTSEFSAWVPVTSVPPIQITLTNSSQISLSWTNNGGSFLLQQTYSLTPPIIWATLSNAPVLSGTFWTATMGLSNIFVSPLLSLLPIQNQLILSWTNFGGSFALEQTYSLTPPIVWSAAPTAPVLTNTFWTATLGTTEPSVFFRLSAPSTVFYRLVAP